MSSARGLTGGTGDVNPQFLTINAIQSGADTTTTLATSIPIQRLPSGARAQVMEVLKIFFDISGVVGTASNSVFCFLSTKSFGTTSTNYSEATVFGYYNRDVLFTTSGAAITQEPFCQDLTDGAGHGLIIATDQIYTQVVSTNTSATNTVRVKVMYRWKNVGLAEYIGIVQSQQS